MENKVDKKTLALAMICGILGCFCYGGGDWLMIYGDTTSSGELFWLTQGASWVIMVSEVLMLPVFLYWFYVVVRGKTTLPRWMAAGNVLVFYVVLLAVKSLLPDTPFRIGFTNGLMSESMIFFFLLIWIVGGNCHTIKFISNS